MAAVSLLPSTYPAPHAAVCAAGSTSSQTFPDRRKAMPDFSLAAGGLQDEVLSFEECFFVYGGQQAFEELEALSNECARSAALLQRR
jgi:hypothetical protein